jgi:hypothetical protein
MPPPAPHNYAILRIRRVAKYLIRFPYIRATMAKCAILFLSGTARAYSSAGTSKDFPLDEPTHPRERRRMSEPSTTINPGLTDRGFIKLHASASAEGVEVNDFIVATLSKHAGIESDIVSQQNDAADTPPPET